MNKIKVSIIIPVIYWRMYWSSIKSTLSEIEIIIVNDETKDNSMKKIEKFLSDECIIIINKKNEGVSLVRNCELEIAKG